MNQNKIFGTVIVLMLIVGVVYFVNKKVVVAPTVVAPVTTATSDTAAAPLTPAVPATEVCYFKETVSPQSTDDAFTSINYDADGRVHGIINWIPGDRDSVVGAYTGTVEASAVPGYPTELNILYTAQGDGVISKEQQVIIVGANDIKTGSGELYQDTDGTYKIKNTAKLTYGNALPKVDCSSVLARLRADYSKTQ